MQKGILLRGWRDTYFHFNSRSCCWLCLSKINFLNLPKTLNLLRSKWTLIPFRRFTRHWLHTR